MRLGYTIRDEIPGGGNRMTMDSFELTKIAGGVLLALLLIFAPRALIVELSHHGPVTGGYELPKPEETAGDAGAGAAAEPKGFDAADVVAMVADASPENGQASFKACAACHSAEKGAASKAGPNLWDVLGRDFASVDDFGGYSDGLKGKEGAWSYEDLAGFLHSPRTWLPGTRMVFNGISDEATLADVIAYIRTLSDSPPPLPEAAAPTEEPAAAEEAPAAAEEEEPPAAPQP